MHQAIEDVARQSFDFIELPARLLEEKRQLIEALLTTSFIMTDKRLYQYELAVRAELVRRIPEAQHRRAAVGLHLHMASVLHQAGLRTMCLKRFDMAQDLAVKALLIRHASDVTLLRNEYLRVPFYSAEVAQACQGKIDREKILEIAALEPGSDPLGTARGMLSAAGVDDPQQLFKDKGFITE